jgi:membrane-associated phospholipid phosphatase
MQYKIISLSKKTFFVLAGIILFLFCFAFWKFAQEMLEKELHSFDYGIIEWSQTFITPGLTNVMKFFTLIGSIKAIAFFFVLSVLLMWWKRKRWEAAFLLGALSGSIVFNLVLKLIFHRERPTIHPLIKETGYSFPSGHSMQSFVFYSIIGYFLFLFFKRKSAKAAIVVLTAGLIFMVGISRIYLGVHYPSDVVASFAAGATWLTVCLMAVRVIIERRKRRGLGK